MTWRKMAVIGIPAIALALGASGGAQAQNLVMNGDFDATNPSFVPPDKEYFGTAIPNSPNGWSIGLITSGPYKEDTSVTFLDSPGTADNHSYQLPVWGPFPYQSPAGGNFVQADGDPNYSGAIYQTISNLMNGQMYAVSFWQAAGQQYGLTSPTTEQWMVGLGDTLPASLASAQPSALFSLPGPGGPTPDFGLWQAQTLYFRADVNGCEVLSFLAFGTPGGEPPNSFLDGVTMQSVPEPSSVVLFGVGLLALVAVYLRRRATCAAV